MFNTRYAYAKVTSTAGNHLTPHLVEKTIYRFQSKRHNTYLVETHEHGQHVFVVKFYYLKHKNNKKRFNVLTDFKEWGGVLRTVVDICIKIHEADPLASFAFIGVPKPTEPEGSPNNQRFRVYKRITETFMGTQTFKHVESEDANSYLLINRSNEGQAEAIIQMLSNIYEDIGDLLGHGEN